MSSSGALTSFSGSSRVQLRLFRFIGILDFEESKPLTSRLLSSWFHLCHCFFCGMILTVCVRNCLRGQYNLEHISETVILLGNLTRFLLLNRNKQELERLLISAEDLWSELKPGERTLVARLLDVSKNLAYAYLGAHVLLCLSCYIGIIPTLQGNVTSRVLPFEFYVEVQSTPWYELVLVLEGIIILSLSLVSTLVDITTGPFLILMGCGHLRTLIHRLRNVESRLDGPVKSSRQFLGELTSCIKYHQMILNYCEQVQRILGGVFLTQLISTSYNISLLGLKVIGRDPDKTKYIILIGVLMLQLLFLQWAPDKLIEESTKVAIDSFLIPPLGLENREICQLICIFIMRAQRSIQLKAAGYVELSMESFAAILTNVVSFFTVLHSFS